MKRNGSLQAAARSWEVIMAQLSAFVASALCIVLTLSMGPSWGQVPADNDRSDLFANTGGGNMALHTLGSVPLPRVCLSGFRCNSNTAYGAFALELTTGSHNTAVGETALTFSE